MEDTPTLRRKRALPMVKKWLFDRFPKRDNDAADAAQINFVSLRQEMINSAPPDRRVDMNAIEAKHIREQYIMTIKHTRSWKNMTDEQRDLVVRSGCKNIDGFIVGGKVSWASLGIIIRGETAVMISDINLKNMLPQFLPNPTEDQVRQQSARLGRKGLRARHVRGRDSSRSRSKSRSRSSSRSRSNSRSPSRSGSRSSSGRRSPSGSRSSRSPSGSRSSRSRSSRSRSRSPSSGQRNRRSGGRRKRSKRSKRSKRTRLNGSPCRIRKHRGTAEEQQQQQQPPEVTDDELLWDIDYLDIDCDSPLPAPPLPLPGPPLPGPLLPAPIQGQSLMAWLSDPRLDCLGLMDQQTMPATQQPTLDQQMMPATQQPTLDQQMMPATQQPTLDQQTMPATQQPTLDQQMMPATQQPTLDQQMMPATRQPTLDQQTMPATQQPTLDQQMMPATRQPTLDQQMMPATRQPSQELQTMSRQPQTREEELQMYAEKLRQLPSFQNFNEHLRKHREAYPQASDWRSVYSRIFPFRSSVGV